MYGADGQGVPSYANGQGDQMCGADGQIIPPAYDGNGQGIDSYIWS